MIGSWRLPIYGLPIIKDCRESAQGLLVSKELVKLDTFCKALNAPTIKPDSGLTIVHKQDSSRDTNFEFPTDYSHHPIGLSIVVSDANRHRNP